MAYQCYADGYVEKQSVTWKEYCVAYYLTLSQTTHLDTSILKELADDNFKFDENGRKFSKRAENTVGKGEIARYEQFLLFPQCFQKTCTADKQKPGLVWERVKKNLVEHEWSPASSVVIYCK